MIFDKSLQNITVKKSTPTVNLQPITNKETRFDNMFFSCILIQMRSSNASSFTAMVS